jgi:hypothetical protein
MARDTGGAEGTAREHQLIEIHCPGDSATVRSTVHLPEFDIFYRHECSPETLRLSVPVDSRVSDVARIISGVTRHRFRTISLKGTVLPKDDLFADYFEPEEVLQLDALPGQKPGVIPLEWEYTGLHEAAHEGHVEVIWSYAARPEFINARTADGATPLSCLLKAGGHRKMVMALLKAGASAKAALPSGSTALSFAKSKGHAEVVSLLEKA